MKVIYISIVSLVFAGACLSQGKQKLDIRIFDQNGDKIQSASVTVSDENSTQVFAKLVKDGSVVLELPADKIFMVEINAKGFLDFKKEIITGQSDRILRVTLLIEPVEIEIEVTESKREERFLAASARILSQDEIAKLPESPEAIKKELKRQFGEDALIKIDGFSDGQFPGRDQIASITIVFSPIDAEFRVAGRTVISIRTRVTKSKTWNGSVDYSLFNSALNARNAFAVEKPGVSLNNLSFFLNPPSFGKNTSADFSFSGSGVSREQILSTRFEDTGFDRTLNRFSVFPEISLKRNLPNSHTLFGKFSFHRSKSVGGGLGTLDFSGRAINSISDSSDLRISASGVLAGRYINQFKLRAIKSEAEIIPQSRESSVRVIGEFNTGGADIASRNTDRSIDVSNLTTFTKNGHYIKFGGGLAREISDFYIASGMNGNFTFASVRDFQNRNPLLFEVRESPARFDYSDTQVSAFVQDYFNLGEFFQVGLGVRWDYQSRFQDTNNFAPRLSFTWSPEKTGRIIVRGGYGRVFLSFGTEFFADILANGENQPRIRRSLFPEFENPLLSSMVSEAGALSRLGELRNPETDIGVISGIFEPLKDFKLITSYVFGRSIYLPRIRNTNAAIRGIRPNPDFDIIRFHEFAGNLTSGLLIVNSKFNINGFSLDFAYNRTKSTVDFTPDALSPNNDNLRLDRGPTDDERRHTIKLSTNFTLFDVIAYVPFTKVNISVNSRILSGLPYNLTTGVDRNGDGILNDRPEGVMRNSEREDWSYSTDLNVRWSPSLFPANQIRKRVSFSASVTNLFNHNNRIGFIGLQTSNFFRQGTASQSARSILFRVNYTF